MSERTANIRLKLSSGAFTGEIKRTEEKVKASGKRMGKEVGRQLDAGFKKGQRSIASVTKSMGRMIKQAATIGGAFATAALLKDSVEIQKKYQDISFLLSKIPERAMSWQQVQLLVEDASDKTTQSASRMADAFSLVYQATGDLEYAKESIEFIGVAATASGKPVEQIAQVADMVRRKWGLTGKAAEEAMSKFIEKSDKGGLSLDMLSSRVDYVAGTAASAGLSVTELLGTVEQLDDKMGEMAPRGLKAMLEYLKEGTTQANDLQKAGRFKFDSDDTALDKIEQLVKNPKAHKAALKIFTETSRSAFDEMRKPFVETLKASKAAGDSDKVAREKAAAAYDAMVADIRKTELTSADIRKSFSKRKETDPSVKMREAIERIRNAFAQPKMIDAMGKLADKLPALADAVADLVTWIMDNPLGAAGVGMGLRVGAPMMMGMFGRGGMDVDGGEKVGDGTARGVGKVGKESTKAAGKVGKMGTSAMGAAGALAGAASIGYTMGKALESIIEAEGKSFDKLEKIRAQTSDKFVQAMSGKATTEDKVAAIKDLKKQRSKVEKQQYDMPGTTEIVRRGMEFMSGERDFSIQGVMQNKDAIETAKSIKEKENRIHDSIIEKATSRLEKESAIAKSAGEIAEALGRYAKDLSKLGGPQPGAKTAKGGTNSRGARKLNNEPGSEPVSG